MSEDDRAIAKVEVIARPLPMVQLTSVGLLLDRPLTYDEWASGLGIGKGQRAYAWAAGDWLVYGEREFPDRYSQAMDATGLSLGRLRNLASLCSRVSRHIRRPGLSLSHHESVASFNEQSQIMLLDTAEVMDLDRDAFRELVAGVKAGSEPDTDTIIISPKKSKDEIIDQAKHVAFAWRTNASHTKIGMTLHQALQELEDLLGE